MAAPTFKEWLPKQTFSISKEDAEKVVDAYHAFNRSRIMCGICGKELTLGERLNIRPENFQYTCAEHERFANDFNVDKPREAFGYYSQVKTFFS